MTGAQRVAEEIANSVTHGVGLLASVVGAAVLLHRALGSGDPWHVASAAVYGGTLVALYAASTLYHSARRPTWKSRLRVVDHCAIYLLIAGTYTPFTLVPLRGVWGWTLLGVVWTLAALGIVYKLFLLGRFPRFSLFLYLAMGWMAVLAVVPMMASLPAGALAWLGAGGLAYTGGVWFFRAERTRFAHAVWHLFVLAGSVCHYLAISLHVLVPGA